MFHGLPTSWLDGQESTTPMVETKGLHGVGESTVEYAILFDEQNPAREAEKVPVSPLWSQCDVSAG